MRQTEPPLIKHLLKNTPNPETNWECTLIGHYADYQPRAISTLSRGLTPYADLLHIVNGIASEAGGEINSELKRYFAYRLRNSEKMEEFDFKILAEELGDIQWFCATFRSLLMELCDRLALNSLTQDEPCTVDVIQMMVQMQYTNQLLDPKLDIEKYTYPPIAQEPSFFSAVYQGVSAINLLASTLHHALIDKGSMGCEGSELCYDLVFTGGRKEFTSSELITSDLQMARMLLSPIVCPGMFGSVALSFIESILAVESITYQVVARIEAEFPDFTQERVWTSNLAKLQKVRYKKGDFTATETFNRALLEEADIVRAIMAPSCREPV